MSSIQRFNQAITTNIIENRKYLKNRTQYLPAFAWLSIQMKHQEQIRTSILMNKGLTVPPILIISVTNDCNLNCEGCYANAQCRDSSAEMNIDTIDRVIQEAYDLGVAIVMLAGGEPLVKKGLLDIIQKYDKLLFVMFTNGLLIDENCIARIKPIKNLMTAISLEGNQKTTDARRGNGVYKRLLNVMDNLDRERLLFGTSITLTRANYEMVMNRDYLDFLEDTGCRTVFLIEYVPCNSNPSLCLTSEQKKDMILKIKGIRRDYNMLPIALPGDESLYDGCLAAGRGFLHISSTGSVEACPFAPYSDVNVKHISLEEALDSSLIKSIRENHNQLEESDGGCTLFEHSEWVKSLTEKPNTKPLCNSFL